MTEIKVILDVDKTTDLGSLTAEERSLVFEQLGNENRDLSIGVLDAFNTTTTELINATIAKHKPVLKELLIRKIINLSRISQNGIKLYNTSVVPVIKFNKSRQNITTDNKQVTLSFDTITMALTKLIRKVYEYSVPSDENIQITNLEFTPVCNTILKSISYPDYDLSRDLITGKYTHAMVSATCNDLFIPLIQSISQCSVNIDDIALQNRIFDYLVELEEQHQTNAPFIYAQIRAAIEGNGSSKLNSVFKVNARKIESNVAPTEKKPAAVLLLESIANVSYLPSGNALIADIYTRGFAPIYYAALKYGVDSKKVNALVSNYKQEHAKMLFIKQIPAAELAEQDKINKYIGIIGKKLGVKRLKEIQVILMKRPPKRADNILDALKPAEKQVVAAEYTRIEKHFEAYLHNKCPHVTVLKVFNQVTNDVTLRHVYDDLREFFAEKTDTKLIPCSNCEFDVICPHVRDLTELELRRASYSEQKEIMTKYISNIASTTETLCKICGGVISSIDIFDLDDSVTTQMLDRELADLMWREVAILMKYLKIKTMTNVPSLITMIRDAIYPFIFEIDKQILKSKTNTAEEIRHKRSLYITIYAFAHILHIVSNSTDIVFKDVVGAIDSKNKLVDNIKHVLEIIMSAKNITIREIPGMNRDIIKNVLIDAYKLLSGAGKTLQMTETEELLITILLDPIYHMYYKMYMYEQIIAGKKISKGKFGPVDAVDIIMGKSLSTLDKKDKKLNKKDKTTDKLEDIYAHVSILSTNQKFKEALNKFVAIKELSHTMTLSDILKTNQLNLGYIVRSFELIAESIKLKLYLEPMYIDTLAQSNTKFLNVQFREPFEKHFGKLAKLNELEQKLIQYRLITTQHPYGRPPFVKTRAYVAPEKRLTLLGRLYDELGNTHSFDIILVNINNKIEEKTLNDLKSGQSFKIVDKKCSTCGIKLSEVNKLSDSKILSVISDKRKISNFYKIFENRCPLGGVHDFVNFTCTKCGMVANDISNVDYYKKYESAVVTKSVAPITIDKPIINDKHAEYPAYTYNFNLLLNLANKLKINYHLLMSLGAVEGREYTTIESGEFIPPEISDRYAPRIHVISGIIKNLITEWNQIRWYSRWLKPTVAIVTLMTESGIPRHKYADLADSLPDVLNDFNAHFKYIKETYKPRDIESFCLQTFCEMLLTIYDDKNEETTKLRHDFVMYFVKKSLRSDELLSKYGHFNWSALYGDINEIKETPTADSADTTNIGLDDGSDDDDKPLKNNFDMEDDDIDDNEDADNNVAVEGYGLD